MTTEELMKKLAKEPEDALDDAVHDAASAEASDVNNQGREAQIDYLITRHGWGHQAILDYVKGVS